MELVEGRNVPPQLGKDFFPMGETVSLLLCLTKSIWGSLRVQVFDSGFSVLGGIV